MAASNISIYKITEDHSVAVSQTKNGRHIALRCYNESEIELFCT